MSLGDPEPTPLLAGIKRRRSESADSDGKRRRLSGERRQSDRRGSSDELQPRDRRRSGQVEDKKRGQRLFGGILGVLSKNKSTTVSSKRAEIEKKQQEKLRAQSAALGNRGRPSLDAPPVDTDTAGVLDEESVSAGTSVGC